MRNLEQDRWNRGLDLFIESVNKPDHELRANAHEQECYNELMEVRMNVLKYVESMRWY
tara:strand:- start:30 stop:203 length:174 start_codon:yes stop_codon:yes gene_type:complete